MLIVSQEYKYGDQLDHLGQCVKKPGGVEQDGADNSQVFGVMYGLNQNLVIHMLPCESVCSCNQPGNVLKMNMDTDMDTDRSTVMIVLY